MKKSYLFFIFILLSFMALNLASVSGQQAKIATDPKRAALGQTKWMSSQLKLDGSLQSVIYGINLKYQLKMDSVRLSISEIPIKMDMYQLITSKKNEEFKKILTPELYSKYQLMIETLKTKALYNRAAMNK